LRPGGRTCLTNAAALAHQFDPLERQHGTGWWEAAEIMFFGGMFTGYVSYRWTHFGAFAEGSKDLESWAGTFNTLVLICRIFKGKGCSPFGR
jgi:heme/copper-type cytochrome/quinol oxidase subunit 3